MTEHSLRLVVRTPEGVVFDEELSSLRVPGSTGQVGLRPRMESAALVVEPGLALAMCEKGLRFVATAGGLLRCDGQEAVLLTPLAVSGENAATVRDRLSEVLGRTNPDQNLRSALKRFETSILEDLRHGGAAAAAGGQGG